MNTHWVWVFSLSCLLTASLGAQTTIGGGACNSSTLNGTYQLVLDGRQITTAGTISKVFQSAGTATFDGQSKVTFTMTANVVSTSQAFGTPLVYAGTYSLQSNCAGSINVTSGDTATFTLESFAEGRTFAVIGSDSTYAYTGTGNMQPSPCPSTLSGVHEFSATGNPLSGTTVTGVLDVAGVLQFDGQGNVTANWTEASNTNTTPVTATGTYSVGSACLGSATLTDSANNKYTVSLSVYSTAPDFALAVASPRLIFQGYGSAAQASTPAATCTAATLNGTYEFLLAGRLVTTAGSITRLTYSAGAATFDGHGKVAFALTANTVATSQAFGTQLAYSGSYTLQSNCQGAISITGGDTATFALVAYNIDAATQQGRNFTMVGTDASFAYNGSGNVQPAACSASTLSGDWAYSANGNTLSGTSVSGVLDVAGLLHFDGQGNASASWTTSSNTATTSVTATGAYSVTSACLGTATLTDTANNKYTWSMSVFGALAANFVAVVANPQLAFSGTGRAAFVNPGQAVVNGASDAAGFTPPGSVFTVFGSGLATGQAQPSSLPLPTTVLTTTLTVNGEPAPIFYLNPTQINAQMPQDIKPGLATVIVKNGTSVSNAVAVMVPATGTPGISSYGQNQAVVVNQDHSVNSPTAPAKVGDVVVAYFTGGGPVQAAGALVTGAPAPNGLSPVTGTSSVTVNGKAATVNYIGLTPQSIGLYQANFVIPQVVAGDHPLEITIAGQASNRPLVSVSN